uniref:Uncharacterized protein n=1 Tax=Siphoviridae sp. ctBCr48 TaxID=2827802 RepID=A0A8S5SHD4_9CAUD|nr:MAG TPA: hypothetical protein [Siphoviridae sp. ctBCr48]
MISHKNRLYLHFIQNKGIPLPQPIACCVLPYGIVVEPSPIRGLDADCPILIIFKLSHFGLFHPYVVVNKTLRVFQQFSIFNVS